MSQFKVLIADDESPARKKMKRLLERFSYVEVVHESENGLDALENIEKLKPDIAFLDIEMPGLNGIEVATSIQGKNMPYLVFATAYNEHAIKAFELNAIDYLLKPFNEERLGDTLEKIRAAGGRSGATEQREKLRNLESEEDGLKLPFSRKIPIPTHDRYKLVDFEDVVMITVEERNTLLHTPDKTWTLNQTLDYFEKKLPEEEFLRVNRSALIGLSHVQEIVIWFGNRFKIVMDNGMDVISSREKSKILKQVLKF